MTMARPTAASAAATVMTKNTMIWPSTAPSARPNATNVRFTAFSMISIDSRIVIRLRRTNTPAAPIANRIAESRGSRSSGDHHRPLGASRRASTTAPTIATRISTEVTSNANA